MKRSIYNEQDYFTYGESIKKTFRAAWFSISYFLGTMIETFKGPYTTIVYEGDTKDAVEQLHHRVDGDPADLRITAREIVYHTRYYRAWVPDSKQTLYQVTATIDEEHKHLFDARLYEPMTYPILCSSLLRWTRFPHVRAMQTHIRRYGQTPPISPS